MLREKKRLISTVLVCGGILVFGLLTAWLLAKVDWPSAVEALLDISPGSAVLAVLFSAISYAGLAGYDVVAVRALRDLDISPPLAAQAGAVSFGISNFLGFPWIIGAAVRQRIYRLKSADLGALVTIVSSGWLAFWLVVVLIWGASLILVPVPAMGLSSSAQSAIGAALAAIAIVCILALGQGRSLTILRREVRLLSRRLTLRQMACAVVDLAASALVLCVILPDDLRGPFVVFLGLFVGAIALGVLSHIPAGVGSFEAVMILGLGAGQRPELSAGLLLYRLFRTVLPFVLSVACLLILESREYRRAAAK